MYVLNYKKMMSADELKEMFSSIQCYKKANDTSYLLG